jgi:uncharacterized protein (TIGR02145 family)
VSIDITGLTAGSIYHFRIKSVNSLGTTYSNDLTFTTLGLVPTVSTLAATNIVSTGAVLNGTVNANYLSTDVTFEYGTTTSYGHTVTATQGPVTGNSITNVSASITGLTAGETYHFRIIAKNSLGTTNGDDKYFTLHNANAISDYDGNYYNIITIGTQIWMAENLQTTKYSDGTAIPNVTDNTAWAALTTPSYCWYNNDVNYKTTYGALYNWYTVDVASNGGRNVCPLGWHVPTNTEWTTFFDYLGVDASGKLKEAGTSHWASPNTGATNESGFTALPGGHNTLGTFFQINLAGWWWSSTVFSEIEGMAYSRALFYDNIDITPQANLKTCGFSIRCIKD